MTKKYVLYINSYSSRNKLYLSIETEENPAEVITSNIEDKLCY